MTLETRRIQHAPDHSPDDVTPSRILPLALAMTAALLTLKVPPATAQLTAVWANNGEDKVLQEELRKSNGQNVSNSVWDGTTIRLLASRNEVVAFNLVLEAQSSTATNVGVSMSALAGPNGATIASTPTSGNGVFDWTARPVELFYVRYLEIKGLGSDLQYNNYDERHIPQRLRRPWSGDGEPDAGTDWFDRPDHDRHYPDIAVPLELVGNFNVTGGQSQSLWFDVYVPKNAAKGVYRGTVTVRQSATITHELPVELTVLDFTLPDQSTAKSMLFLGAEDIGRRYAGNAYPDCGSAADTLIKRVRDRHFLLAHRHRIALIDSNDGACDWSLDQPRTEWLPRLNGSLFTAANGYAGPGTGVGNDVFSIGTYGGWDWQGEGQQSMWNRTNNWESWFAANSPGTTRFLYLADEPGGGELAQVQQWASWMENNPGPGSSLQSFCTISAPEALDATPALDISASWFTVGEPSEWQSAVNTLKADSSKAVFLYNGNRPAGGSFAIEDDGVALRVLAWAQYKKKIDRWFFWESTYYDNFQGNTGETNVFETAQTFGDNDGFDSIFGDNGWNYGNGDGVLFYPGTDVVYPEDSYGVEGPIASLRLKHWRRGIQDVEYLAAAAQIDAAQTAQIVQATVPKVFWEYGVSDPEDPTWVLSDISWSTDPDDWEAARCQLAKIIDPGLSAGCEASPTIFADGFESGNVSGWSSSQ